MMVLGLLGAGLLAAITMAFSLSHGTSAREEPTALEAFVARRVRGWSMPLEARGTVNPLPATDEVLAQAREHFADHCALCHGNDGRGQTSLGRNLYPKAPDMQLPATQSLSDGQLFSIITNGVRHTGMPAWGEGTEEDNRQTWALVHFIRRLPELTPEEAADMERFNPRSRAELEEEESIRRFLEGEEDVNQEPPSDERHHAE